MENPEKQTTEQPVPEDSKETVPDNRNYKEKLYDKIPVSVKALDIIIGVLITILVIMLMYFIIRKVG